MNEKQTRYFLIILTAIAYISFGLLTSVIGVIIDKVQAQYSISLQIAALLPFAFYISYGVFSIPFGLAMDRWGAKWVIFLGLLCMSLGSYILYFAESYIIVIWMIFLGGLGVTAIQTAGNPFIRSLDTPQRYTANLTIIIGIGGFGYFFSPLMVPIVQAQGFSWDTVYLIFGILNSVLLLLFMFVKFPEVAITEEERIRLSNFMELIKNPIILTYALGIFLYVGGEVGVSSYIVTLMRDVHNLSPMKSFFSKGTLLYAAFPSISAFCVALFWGLQAIGRLIMGPVMNRISPKKIFIFYAAGTCICLVVAILGTTTISWISFALVGFFTSVLFTLIFSAAIQSFERYHGTISGILCLSIVGGAVIGWLVGVVGSKVNLKWGMVVSLLAFLYVLGLSIWGKGRLEYVE